MEMVETITENNLPTRFTETYEGGGVWLPLEMGLSFVARPFLSRGFQDEERKCE